MTGFGKKFSKALVLVGLTGAIACGDTNAAEMPSMFRGVWGDSCDLPKEDVGEFPFLIVTARGYEAYETSCTLISSSIIKGTNRHSLNFSCESEGIKSRDKEVWSITHQKAEIGDRTISQPFLVTSGGGRHKKCALIATPRR
jgi:hypothetical protein